MHANPARNESAQLQEQSQQQHPDPPADDSLGAFLKSRSRTAMSENTQHAHVGLDNCEPSHAAPPHAHAPDTAADAQSEQSGSDHGDEDDVMVESLDNPGDTEQSDSKSTSGDAASSQPSPFADPITTRTIDPAVDTRSFASWPGPRKGCLCHIVRERGRIGMYPSYKLYLEGGTSKPGSKDRRKFLLSARKRKKSKSANYLISLDHSDLSRRSGNYFGKLRANYLGTEFVMYDKGVKYSNASVSSGSSQMAPRKEIGAVMYDYNVPFSRGPRKMTAILPAVDSDGTRVEFMPTHDHEQSMLSRYKELRSESCPAKESEGNMVLLSNKQPKWNDELGAWCLNFHGRVTKASVKNFQLVSESNPERVILQFGKVGEDIFTMDFCWPMSALQAFMLCLTSFDSKLGCVRSTLFCLLPRYARMFLNVSQV